MTDKEAATAEALAVRPAVCPACGSVWHAPENTDALEWACEPPCHATLRLEPYGCVREVVSRGVVMDLEGL